MTLLIICSNASNQKFSQHFMPCYLIAGFCKKVLRRYDSEAEILKYLLKAIFTMHVCAKILAFLTCETQHDVLVFYDQN